MKAILPARFITLDYHGATLRIRAVIYGRMLPVVRLDDAPQHRLNPMDPP
jgi:hypothetical protein